MILKEIHCRCCIGSDILPPRKSKLTYFPASLDMIRIGYGIYFEQSYYTKIHDVMYFTATSYVSCKGRSEGDNSTVILWEYSNLELDITDETSCREDCYSQGYVYAIINTIVSCKLYTFN